ncbi:MAG: RNA-binding protein [Chloroflexota bacterium]
MENKLYVGNLSYNVSDADLQALFEQAGTVKSVQIIKDRDTGRSKGFAFIEMETQEEAQKAISMFNGKEIEERALKVSIARPRKERDDRWGGDRRRGGRRRPGGGRDRYE